MWLRPSLSHTSSKVPASFTYRRREALMRCWNSWPMTATAKRRTDSTVWRRPTSPNGSGTTM